MNVAVLSRIPYLVLILICAVVVVSTLATGDYQHKSTSVVQDLLAAVSRGDVNSARQMLGDNTCSCPPIGGWVSLLRYESGHEPNLAFLLRHEFVISDINNQLIHLPHSYIFPWDKPEDRKIELNIRFLDAPPYFLPLKLAFGLPMQEGEFKQWCDTFKDETNPRAFTLRLRNSLKPGTIANVSPDKREAMLPPALRPYIHPKDCGAVLDQNSKAVPIDALALQLPRLKAVHASFAVVRRGILNPWTIKSANFTDPNWLQ